MQQLSAQRMRVAAPAGARHLPTLVSVRPTRLAPLRFKEDDKIQQTKNKVANLADQVNNAGNKTPAYDSAVKVTPFLPAFTRRREVFTGRLAMLGFLAACVGECIQPGHPGAIGQVVQATGLSPQIVIAALAIFVGYNSFAATVPGSPTYSKENQEDVRKRPDGPGLNNTNNGTINADLNAPSDIKQALGISGWGFTKRNEVFVGRTAMLGFAAAILGEISTGGKGPIAQLAGWLGRMPDAGFYSVAIGGFWLSVGTILFLATVFPSHLEGRPEEENEIY